MPNSNDRGREPTMSVLGTQVGCGLVATVALLAWWLWGLGTFGKLGAVLVVAWAILGNRVLRLVENSQLATRRRERLTAAKEARQLAERRTTKCAHGVVGGVYADACATCRGERQRLEHEQSERQRREELRNKAQSLERAEVVRLAKERRRRVHSLLQLSPRQFEKAIAELYEARGFKVILTPSTNDGGRDVIAENDNQTLYIECKRYAAGNLVSRPDLQKLVGAIPDGRIVGVFVTTSGFSSPATKYAKERGVTLIDGLQLDAMLRETFPNLEGQETVQVACPECGIPVQFPVTAVGTEQACANWHIVSNTFDPRKVDALLGRRAEQACDRCGSEMVLRKGRRGKFWGCAEYPSCQFTRPFGRDPKKE